MRHLGHKVFLCLYMALVIGVAVHLASDRAANGAVLFAGQDERDQIKDALLFVALPTSGAFAALFGFRNELKSGYNAVMLGVSAVLLVYLMS